MNFNFWNPLSDRFLQVEPEHSQQRQADAANNSFGKSEDPRNWRNAVMGQTIPTQLTLMILMVLCLILSFLQKDKE